MSRTFVTLRVARPKFAPLTLRKLHISPERYIQLSAHLGRRAVCGKPKEVNKNAEL